MEIVLVNSPLFREKKENHDPDDFLPPIGLGYIATKLRENNIDCLLIDAVVNNISMYNLIEQLNSMKPIFIGMNFFSTNLSITKEIVESISFETTFIAGGNSVQFLYTEIFSFVTKNKIIGVIGDGELITIDIVKQNIKQSPITINEIYTNRTLYKVDSTSVYFPKDISDITLDRSFFTNEPLTSKINNLREISIITSRGCIYNCAFCGAARKLNKHSSVRERSAQSIMKELDYIEKTYINVRSIRILDDLFLKNNQNIKKAIDIFSPRKELLWRSMAHTMSFTKSSQEGINSLKKSGCYELSIGIESGSEKILRMIHKPNQIDNIKDIFKKIFFAGINVKGYFIYGFPTEEVSDANKTLSLALELTNMARIYGVVFRTSVFQFRPYHGTELYNYLAEENLLIKEMGEDLFLSAEIGRSQFNFNAGNYGNMSQNEINYFIKTTLLLNEGVESSIFNLPIISNLLC
ncbi:MAG: radical SAM protein [Campylobacterales bacterium]|nr:radical SAM protein [Campylobacterales bacterium]